MRYELSNRTNWHPFAQLMKHFEDDFFTPYSQGTSAPNVASPRMEYQENDKAYLLSFDIPGMRPEDIKIDLHENVLTISAERKQNTEKKEGDSLRSERFYGIYQRKIELPREVKAEDVQADYNHGVLEVLIPKTEKSQAKSIQIGKEGRVSEKFLNAGSEKQVSSAQEKQKSH